MPRQLSSDLVPSCHINADLVSHEQQGTKTLYGSHTGQCRLLLRLQGKLEINKDHPSENKQNSLLGACYNKGVSHLHLHLAETQADMRVQKLQSRKGKGFKYSLVEGCWQGEAGGGASHVIG